MPIRKTGLSVIMLLLAGVLPVNAAEPLAIVTIADSPIESLSQENVKLIYLRKTLLDPNGKRWIPLNLPQSSELRRAFSMALFGVLPEDQEDYWNDQYFQGISPPEVMASEEAVLRFIAITPGAIGYVQKQNVDNRVKVVKIVTSPLD